MRVRTFLFALAAMMLPSILPAEAQQPTMLPRIGFLSGGSPGTNPIRDDAFRQGLKALGYIEGRNIIIEWRFAEEKPERYRELATDLVRLKVQVVVTTGSTTTRAAREVITAIPIVMARDPDPVGNGFVASLARPGGNITGLSSLGPQLSGKRLELLKEIIPKLSRVAVFGDSSQPGNVRSLRETEAVATALAVQLQYLDVQGHKDIETLFIGASEGRADAVLVLGGHILTSQRTRLAELAVKSRLPTMNPAPVFVQAGGLANYGVSTPDLFRRAATYVDKILKGKKPADLPVERPKKFDLLINLKTAKQIGLTIPPNVLARADRVIR